MITEKKNFYIITGGPGSGKTTLIEGLRERGFLCVGEVGRQIIQEQLKIDGDALHNKNQRKFCDLMLSRSMYTFEQVAEKEKPVFFDRGIPELIGYCHLINAEVPHYLKNAANLFRYNPCVFIAPPWEAIYQHDAERKQNWQETVETYHCVANAHIESGYQLIELPKVSVTERIHFILARVAK
jgi:predicted ATPase